MSRRSKEASLAPGVGDVSERRRHHWLKLGVGDESERRRHQWLKHRLFSEDLDATREREGSKSWTGGLNFASATHFVVAAHASCERPRSAMEGCLLLVP